MFWATHLPLPMVMRAPASTLDLPDLLHSSNRVRDRKVLGVWLDVWSCTLGSHLLTLCARILPLHLLHPIRSLAPPLFISPHPLSLPSHGLVFSTSPSRGTLVLKHFGG
jgi:hypothetical protein